MTFLFFADDTRQLTPSRKGMGPLVGVGGLQIPTTRVRSLEHGLEVLCRDSGFPTGEKFKWSPGKGLWMRDHLVGEKRRRFFLEALALARDQEAKAVVVVEDVNYRPATGATHELDVVRMLLERVHRQVERESADAIVVVDRPGGDRGSDERFLLECLETVKTGTGFVVPERVVLVVTTASSLVRLLQLADLVTACTVARVGGENRHSPRVFEMIRPILFSVDGRVGGFGLKVHPDIKYANLYHWLVADTDFVKKNSGYPLPYAQWPYGGDEMVP